jgi:hypothetical protein
MDAPTNDPSSYAASAPRGTRNTCWKSWDRCDVNSTRCPEKATLLLLRSRSVQATIRSPRGGDTHNSTGSTTEKTV